MSIKEYISKLTLDENTGLLLNSDRFIAYGTKEIIFIVFEYEEEIDPIAKIFVSNKDLIELRQKKIRYIKISESVLDLKYLLKIPLETYEIYLYYEDYPVLIRYYDKYFTLGTHNCTDKCKHEVTEIKSTINIKKLSEY
jgi:hypothetical protein